MKKLPITHIIGLLFPELKEDTSAATGFIKRYAKKAGIAKEVNEIKEDINNFPQKISAHSGRVSFYVEGRRGGQTQAELAHTLRWMPGSAMPDYYERIYRETLPTGAPTVVAEMRLKKRTSTASNPTSNQVNGELSILK